MSCWFPRPAPPLTTEGPGPGFWAATKERRASLDGAASLPLLLELLGEAREFGLLGPGPVEPHLSRSLAFAAVTAPPTVAADLGSGGGVPGLPLALLWPDSRWTFIESHKRRADWLSRAVVRLGLDHRCSVLCERAETTPGSGLRGSCQLVTARSFAPPGPTAECAAPLLGRGGHLVVAEPPEDARRPVRWPADGLAKLGLGLQGVTVVDTSAGPASMAVLDSHTATHGNFPRRVGLPFKRPLF